MKKLFSKNYILSLSTVVMLASCAKTDYLNIDAADRPPLVSYQSFVNVLSEGVALDFYNFEAKLTTESVLYRRSSPYYEGHFGSVQINVTESEKTAYLASRLFGNSAAFTPNGGPNGPIATFYHTVFAAKTQDGSRDSLILVYDDLTPPSAQKIKFRFLNLANGTSGSTIVDQNSTPVFSGINYAAASNQILEGEGLSAWSLAPFTEVDISAFRVEIPGEFIEPKDNGLAGYVFEPGKAYTVFTHTVADGTGYGVSVIEHTTVQANQ